MGYFKANYTRNVTLSADGVAVPTEDVALILLASDSTTATDRTFTLNVSSQIGHRLILIFTSGSSYTAQLEDTGTMKLQGGDWTPLQYDTIELISDGTNWVELSRTVASGVTDIALASGNILVGNSSGLAASVTMSGDVSVNNAGVAAIGSGVIVNADVNASAAIAYSKLNLASSVASTDFAEDVLKVATGTLTQANLLAIGTPVSLIAAPGAGKVIVVDEIEMFHDYAVAAYATGADLEIEYATSGDNIALIADTFVTGGADQNIVIKPSTYNLDGSTGTGVGFDVTANINKAVQATGTNFTNGDATNIIKWRIRYHVLTVLT